MSNSQLKWFEARTTYLQSKVGNIMKEIGEEIGTSSFADVTSASFDRRGITKDKLCGWLGSLCKVMDNVFIPFAENVTNYIEKYEQLEQERLEDKKTIIQLQNELIVKKDAEIATIKESLQSTVEKEMKSYASTVSQNCSKALAPKRISAAFKCAAEKEDRRRNIIVYGVEEAMGEKLVSKVEDILEEIGEKPVVKDCCRLGMKKNDAIRPIKFSLNSSDMVRHVLLKSKLLKGIEKYKSVFISPDRTLEERVAYREARDKRKKETVSSRKDTESFTPT